MGNDRKNIVAAIEVLGETISKLKDDVFFKDAQIKDLRKQLEAAENELKIAVDVIDARTATNKDLLKQLEAAKGATQ